MSPPRSRWWPAAYLPVALMAGCSLMLAACAAVDGTRAEAPGRLLTTLDYLAAGIDGLRRYVAQADAESRARIEAALRTGRAAVVRVEVRSPERDGAITVRRGTGVRVENGQGILTAGHVLVAVDAADTVRVTPPGGAAVEASVASFEYERFERDAVDLGRLRVKGIADGVRLATPSEGELVVILGYPDGFGLARGDVLMDGGLEERALEPIPVLARVESARPLSLALVAGSMPIQGMSGSPLFDLEGNCVGILARVEVSETGAGESRWRIVAARIDA